MKYFTLIALLGLTQAKHEHINVLLEANGCPAHEPLCEGYERQKEHIKGYYNVQTSAHTHKKHHRSLRQSLAQSEGDGQPGMLEKAKPCPEPLEISVEEMNIRMEFFSRTFDKRWYNDSMKIWDELKKKGYKGSGPHVTTRDLYNNAFSFPRVRRYGFVVEGMNTIEQFEDNLTMNLSNSNLLN